MLFRSSPAAEQRLHLPQTITRMCEAKRNKGVSPRFRLDVRDAPLISPNVGDDGSSGRRGCAYAHSEQPLSEKIAGGDPGGTKRRESFDSKRAQAYIIYCLLPQSSVRLPALRRTSVIYGIFLARLRVADASIMPLDCRANTHFTSVMIGEAIAAR